MERYLWESQLPATSESENSKQLFQAIARGQIDVVKFFIDNGVDVNCRDNAGYSPLHMAVWHERIEIAKLLVAIGADVNAKAKNGMTPLHCAGMCNPDIQVTMLRFLISNNADVKVKTNDGSTVFDYVWDWWDIEWDTDDEDILGYLLEVHVREEWYSEVEGYME